MKPYASFHSDVGEEAAGFNLTQVPDGLEQSTVYGGRNFSNLENKCSTTEQEALSVINAVEKCRRYL